MESGHKASYGDIYEGEDVGDRGLALMTSVLDDSTEAVRLHYMK